MESFAYARTNPWIGELIPRLDDFLLDSGAFTAMGGRMGGIDWDKYIEEYAEFILRYKVKKYIELDIDEVVGLERVEAMRRKLERLVGWPSIPVWHINRGWDYYRAMCRDYSYIAIGGLVKKNKGVIPETLFPKFIDTAHEAGAKVHGLGYTKIAGLHLYHFDSVDSTAWLYGNRGGYLYRFNAIEGIMEKYKKEGCRLKSHEAAIHNYLEWQKFQDYAEQYL